MIEIMIVLAPDDLSVKRGDWIYADLNNQTVEGWLWYEKQIEISQDFFIEIFIFFYLFRAYAPKTRKYGFIPKAYARPPAMTSL